MQCRHCQSDQTKKNGHSRKGKQYYLCKACGRAFAETPDARHLTLAERTQAQKLYEEGLSGRAVSRAVGKGLKAVRTFLKKSAKLPAPPSNANALN